MDWLIWAKRALLPGAVAIALAATTAACGSKASSDDSELDDDDLEDDDGSGRPPKNENDPCDGISAFGICDGESTVKVCSAPSGQAKPSLVTIECSDLESCQVDGSGRARCQKLPGKCEPGASECAGGDQARRCNDQGSWETHPCAQCKSTALGAVCGGGAAIPTKAWSGSVAYEAKGPAAGITAWESLGFVAATGALVVSYRYDPSTNEYEAIDATVAGAEGDFTVAIPKNPSQNDIVAVIAVRANESGTAISFGVAEPAVPNGEWDVSKPISGNQSSFWSWAWRSDSLGASGGTLPIDAESGSGAMQVFDWMRYGYEATEYLFGKPGLSLVIWMRNNTSWNCGACQAEFPARVESFEFESQIWLPMTARDESYWSDAVTGHELGHWAMGSFGQPAVEGGSHIMSCPTFPGQAWSEGFATWFSALARTESIYYDKQDGTFFWLDIDRRKYHDGTAWPAPEPAGGLLQMMDENEVSATLWGLSDTTWPAFTQPQNQIFFDALASPVVKKGREKPYGRGYYRHTWELASGCGKKNVVETNLPLPMLADYLDALRCEGMSAAKVDAVTKPATRYPYPSASPICN